MLCVNKMDLVDWDQDRFEEIKAEFRSFAMKLDVHDLSFMPDLALHGDNVVHRSDNIALVRGLVAAAPPRGGAHRVGPQPHRRPLPGAVRDPAADQTDDELHDYRGYAGTVAGGVFKPGDEVVVLPSGFTSTIAAIDGPGGEPVDEAFAPMAVTIRLADEIDISRGDMICRVHNQPHGRPGHRRHRLLAAPRPSPLRPGGEVHDQAHDPHRSRRSCRSSSTASTSTRCTATRPPTRSRLNEIGRVRLRTQSPLFFDEYRRNRTTGSFILIDEATNATVAAGMISG